MTGLISPDAGWIVAAAVPVVLAGLANVRKMGRLEQKVDGLGDQMAQQAKINQGVIDRLEQLGEKFSEHAVQDASHFGEIRGMLRPSS